MRKNYIENLQKLFSSAELYLPAWIVGRSNCRLRLSALHREPRDVSVSCKLRNHRQCSWDESQHSVQVCRSLNVRELISQNALRSSRKTVEYRTGVCSIRSCRYSWSSSNSIMSSLRLRTLRVNSNALKDSCGKKVANMSNPACVPYVRRCVPLYGGRWIPRQENTRRLGRFGIFART